MVPDAKQVKAAQRLWNTRDPSRVVQAYTENSVWRNRGDFIVGHKDIEAWLWDKWAKEQSYKLKKQLFAYDTHRIAVQFWYEYVRPAAGAEGVQWWRCYGLEHWTFAEDGRMRKRHMSGNDVPIKPADRWFSAEMTDEEIDAIQVDERDG